MHQCPILLAFPKKLPPLNKCLPPGLLPLLHLSIHLDPSSSIPLQTWQMSHLLVRPCPRKFSRGLLIWSGQRWCPCTRHWQEATKKHLIETPIWWGRQERNTLGVTAQTSIMRTPATSQMSLDAWSRSLVYLALPSMRLSKNAQGGTNCGKLIMC